MMVQLIKSFWGAEAGPASVLQGAPKNAKIYMNRKVGRNWDG